MKRVYLYEERSDASHYSADAYVIRCFDNRFWKAFKHFLKDLKLGHIDLASVAGGAKVLSSPEKECDADFTLREIEKSVRLHHTKRVMLFTHSDCGAYGGLKHFDGNKDKELDFHSLELGKARDAVK